MFSFQRRFGFSGARPGAALRLLCALFTLMSLLPAPGLAQTAAALHQVKRVYVDSFGDKRGATELRSRLVQRLRDSHKVTIVEEPASADASVKGNGEIWVKGYLSTGQRASASNRVPVFGGYLSVELKGKGNETLWSYLVTPSAFASGSVVQDMADKLAKRLLTAIEEGEVTGAAAGGHNAGVTTTLRGAGATFPAPLYQQWFQSFREEHPEIEIKYDAVGSGGGIERLKAAEVDFAASDMPLTDAQMDQMQSRFTHFASVLGAVVPIYNVGGLSRDIHFTPETLAGIYMGRIKRWNDPLLKPANNGLSLPDAEIVVVHRSDASGTTYAWTDFLSRTNPEWKAAVGSGTTVNWTTGLEAEGNSGVADAVQKTRNSIGYVELTYAIQHELSFGAVRNAAGQFVAADLASLKAAAAGAARGAGSDFRVSIVNAPGKGSYPIASFTWFLLPDQIQDAGKKAAMIAVLRWMLTSGQKRCSALGYAPLPRELAERELQALDNLK